MGSEARARLGLAGLLFVVLYSFTQLFAEGSYAGPAMMGAVLATVMAMGCRRLGMSVAVTVGLSLAAMTWYLMIVFQAGRTLFGLPTPGAAGGLLRSIARSYSHSQVDFAPVPSRPGYVILIVLVVWLLALLGEIATFRWRRPLVATIGPLAMFSFVLIVGTNAGSAVLVPLFLVALLTYLGLESAHRLRSWGRWVATWRGRRSTEPESVTGGLARRMGATCVVVALAAPAFLPSLGDGLLAWRNAVGDGTFGGGRGGSIGSTVDPLVSIVPEFLEQSESELFRVRSDKPAYWKLVTLTDFDGEKWTPGTEPDAPAPTGAIASSELAIPDPGETIEQSFEILGLGGQEVPAATLPATVEFTDDSSDRQHDLAFDVNTGDLELDGALDEGVTYRVFSTLPDATFQSMRDAVPGDLGDEFTRVPAHNPEIDDLAREWTKDASSPFEELLAIQNNLRTFQYSEKVDNSATSDYLHQFLTETKAGYCQQFATAFAILARIMGFSTRVGVGFLPGQSSLEAPDEYLVRGTDAHAWPEVYFEGFGWVVFEPTPRGAANAPSYTIPGGLATTFGGGNIQAIENREQNPRGGGAGQDPQVAEGGPAGDANVPDPRERSRRRWQNTFENLTRTVLIVLVLFLLAVPALKAWRVRNRYAAARDPRGRAEAAFGEFEQEAGELAFPRYRAESAVTYARRVAADRRLPRASAMRLASIFEAAQYAPRAIPSETGDEARRLARELTRNLWSGATWWDRALRLFSPLGLARRPKAG